jgi:hypothetical protein
VEAFEDALMLGFPLTAVGLPMLGGLAAAALGPQPLALADETSLLSVVPPADSTDRGVSPALRVDTPVVSGTHTAVGGGIELASASRPLQEVVESLVRAQGAINAAELAAHDAAFAEDTGSPFDNDRAPGDLGLDQPAIPGSDTGNAAGPSPGLNPSSSAPAVGGGLGGSPANASPPGPSSGGGQGTGAAEPPIPPGGLGQPPGVIPPHGKGNPPALAPSITASGTTLTGNESPAVINQLVATFSDSDGNTNPALYSATINWGDNTGTTQGQIGHSTGSNFTVSGSHTYEEGTYTLTISITDTDGSTATANSTARMGDNALSWTGGPQVSWGMTPSSNQLPVITNPNGQGSAEGATVSLQIHASDSDGDTLTYAAVGLPTGLSINSSTGLISGTVDYADAEYNNGLYPVTVVVGDGQGGSASATFNWSVTNTDRAPVVTNPGNQTNGEGDAVWQNVSASDPDGDVLTYSATGLPPGISIDHDLGLLNGQISVTAANGSPYTSTVTASDGVLSTSQTFTWTVTHLGVTNSNSQSNIVGDSVSLPIQANDPDGDILSYSATGLPSGLSINSSTGVITGTIATGADAGSPYSASVSASDELHSTSQTFTWTVAHLGVTNPGNPNNADSDVVSLPIQASDADHDTLTYSASGLPPGLSINSSTGLISGTLSSTADSGSPYAVTVSAADAGNHSASQTFTWTVTHVGLANPGNQSNGDGDTVSLVLSAHDNDHETLTYSANGLPGGLSINSSSGVISGTLAATADTSSPYSVTVTATDAASHSTSQTFTWTVIQHIAVTNPGSRLNADGDLVSLPISALDPEDGDTLTYSASGLPAGLSISSSTGLISGTIGSSADSGSPYTVSVSATDGTYTVSQTFTWTVTHLALANPGNQTNTDRDTVSLAMQGRDADHDTLTYSASGLPSGLSINTGTGVISGTLGNSADTASPYSVTVSVSDPANHTASQTFSWIVGHLSVTSPGDQSSADGDTISLQIQANDPDGDTLTYTATGLPPGLSINAGSGLITGSVASTADTGSPYTVTVTASDSGNHSTSQTFSWNVVPRVTMNGAGDQVNADGDAVSLAISASDAHGASLTYSATGLPAGLSINSSTGVISGTVANTADTSSPYAVTVTATYSTFSASQSFTWSIVHIAVTAPANQSNADGDTVSLQIQSRHTDSTAVTYSASGLPPGLSINASTGLIAGTLTSNADAASPYSVTVQATEGNYSGGQTFTWTISHVGISTPANQNNTTGNSVSLQVQAYDHDGDTLTYSATGLPTGLSINSATGLISGTIASTATSGSPYSTTVTAADSSHSSAASFSWTVTPATNQAPVVANPGTQINNEDDNIGLPIVASDSDGEAVTFSSTGLPPGLSIDPVSGWITGLLDETLTSNLLDTVTVTATDGSGSSASQTFNWIFTAPVLSAQGVSVSATEGIPLSYVPVATFSNSQVGSGEVDVGYPATINWGDSTALDTGTVTGSNGSYTVLGNHTYNDAGTYTVTVTISDVPYTTVTATSTATVSEASLSATGVAVNVLKGASPSVAVATFTDANPGDPNYAASIHWGDSITTPGQVQVVNGQGVVYGSHAYSGDGSYPVSVYLDGSTNPVATSTATVGDVYEGTQANLTISGFTDGDPNGVRSDYSATITWGDGSSPVSGTIGSSYPTFTISGSHTYIHPGAYTVTATVADVGGAQVSGSWTVYAAEQPLTAYSTPIYGTVNKAIPNQTLAVYADVDPNGNSSGASASVTWGDGSSGGTTLVGAGGLFIISGGHTYPTAQAYPVSVNLQPVGVPPLPVLLAAIVAADPAVKAPFLLDIQPGVKGRLGWEVKPTNPLGIESKVLFKFFPNKDNPSTHLTFLQVSRQFTVGYPDEEKPVWPYDETDRKELRTKKAETYKRFSINPKLATGLDFQYGDTSPYLGAEWNGKKWVPETSDSRIGVGKSQTMSVSSDEPGFGRVFGRAGKGPGVAKFETAVFSIDSQEILGDITWGFTVPDNGQDPIVLINGKWNKDPKLSDYQLSASGDFKKVIALANKVGVGDDKRNKLPMTHAQLDGSPRITKPNAKSFGGTSALP